MHFDLANRNLAQKVSILVLGITLFVSLAIGGVGELVLQSVSAKQAKQAGSLAALDRLVNQGGAVLSPVMGSDGRVVGMMVMRTDAGPAVIPASYDGQGLVVRTAESTVVSAQPDYANGAGHVFLLLAGIAVFAVVALVGTRIARGLLEPLGQLEKEVDLLARGNTNVRISALSRTDEIGRIARSMARIQESLVELAKIKTQRLSVQSSNLVGNLKEMWSELKASLRTAKELLSSDSQMIGKHFKTSWNNWLHGSLGIPTRA
jgi:methyl-accepting chemotaxis protein